MNKVILRIKRELRRNSNLAKAKKWQRFFKEKVKSYGIKSAVIDEMSKRHFKDIEHLTKKEIFFLCERLLESGYNDEIKIALDWADRLKRRLERSDFVVFENWLEKYITNWGSCDDFCTHAFGNLIFRFPEFLPKTKKWAKSPNKWLRRASAVILIYSLRKGKYMKNAFGAAGILLRDSDDLAQKGYGWMLKEAGKLYRKEVFDFVMKNKKLMPRTALRYAVEKLPEKMRKKAMKK